MFTREDYVRYFSEIAHVERRMIYFTNDTIAQLSNERIINNIRRVAADEVKHYSFVLDLLAAELGFGKNSEQRLNARGNSLGPVDLTRLGSDPGSGFRGYCANLSPMGMCLESAKPFHPGEQYTFKFEPYDHREPAFERKGRVVWMREILDFYIGGIAFDA